MNTNPLIDFAAHPNFADVVPAQVADAVTQVIAQARAAVEAVCADAADADSKTDTTETGNKNSASAATVPTWENLMMPLEAATEQIQRVWNQVELMHSVMSNEAWRQAHADNLGAVVAFFAELSQNAPLYRKMRALAESAEFARLPAARRKIITDALRDFELAGVALPPAPAQQFRQNSKELAGLAARFEQNLLAATNDFFITVTDAADLGDMPADLQATAAAAAAAAAQQAGDTAADTTYRFTLHPPSYTAFMQYVRARPLRERMYRAHSTRASEHDRPDRDNTPLMAQIIRLRQQQATLLGYPTYAEYALQTRMAPSVAAVQDFLRDLARRARPPAQAELRQLRDFAAATLGITDLQAWDVPYAAECQKRQQFDFSDAELRPYLQQSKILDGLFACIRHLFGITLRPAQTPPPVWTGGVQYLEVADAADTVIGGIYLDLHARESKRGGAWMADALSRYKKQKTGEAVPADRFSAAQKTDTQLQRPLAHIVCNFSAPDADGSALLNWQEVVTLFHECGHALHHLLTEVDEYSASGISGVEWDAVELPSQLLENFVWDWQTLQPMTAHAESGEPMPRALFDRVLAAKNFHSGLFLLRQLEFALFDITLHHRPPADAADAADTIAATLAKIRDEISIFPPPAYNRFQNSFAHIFAGGYAAGYYSYLWAEVLAADIYEMFQAETTAAGKQAVGAQFRCEVLAVGGSRPAMESFKALRHREPTITPLLTHYNLT